MNNIKILITSSCLLCAINSNAQKFEDGKMFLNDDGTHYIKATAMLQSWVRAEQYNNGTTIFGYPKSSGLDIGIRRYRFQLMSQVTDRIFFYTQVGENNFNNISERKLGFFVHDAVGEYAIDPKKLSVGMGLTAWSGLSRFASPSTGTILGIDAPLYQQSTNDVTDQFLRKLGVYAKGKLGKLDYRITMAQPLAIQRMAGYTPTISTTSSFSPMPPKMQWNGYFQYQFKDQESNTTPYAVGSYLGKKRVFNIGIGSVYQANAMWHLENKIDTVQTAMLQLAADIFYDAPVGQKGAAISAYGNFTHFDYGPNYTRNLAVMNPANGTNNPNLLNGGGNGFPSYGTGNVFYAQVGYKLAKNLTRKKINLMPYAALQYANYERLNSPMTFYDAGINWYINDQTCKLTLAYQNRPEFLTNGDKLDRKSAFLMQFQIYLH
jgi:hypothetical protein